jgi:DNA-binding CsgD family transcriptional regulator
LDIISIYSKNNHVDLSCNLTWLAKCYFDLNQLDTAQFYCEESIKIGNIVSKDGLCFDVADAYYQLSMALQAKNGFLPTNESMECFKKALDMYHILTGNPNHPDILKANEQLILSQKLSTTTTGNKVKKNTFEIKISDKKILLLRREAQCLFFLMKGMSAKQTAYHLFLSQRTVETYLEQVRNKFNCRTKLELLSKLPKKEILEAYQKLNSKVSISSSP